MQPKKTKAKEINHMEKKEQRPHEATRQLDERDTEIEDSMNTPPQRKAPEPVRATDEIQKITQAASKDIILERLGVAPEKCPVDGCTSEPPCTKHGAKP